MQRAYRGSLRETQTSQHNARFYRRGNCPRAPLGISHIIGQATALGPTVINIYVGNLTFSTTDSDLEDLFSQFGQINRAAIITDRETGRSRGFGFVEMENEEEGKTAIEKLNETDFEGRQLTVNEARPRAPRPAGGGYGGGGGGGGYSGR